jgi:hypothetical protein
MLLSIKDSKIREDDYLTQVELTSGDTSQVVWIKTNYAELNLLLVLKDDPREWEVTRVYIANTQLAKNLHPDSEAIWETQPIQRGNK